MTEIWNESICLSRWFLSHHGSLYQEMIIDCLSLLSSFVQNLKHVYINWNDQCNTVVVLQINVQQHNRHRTVTGTQIRSTCEFFQTFYSFSFQKSLVWILYNIWPSTCEQSMWNKRHWNLQMNSTNRELSLLFFWAFTFYRSTEEIRSWIETCLGNAILTAHSPHQQKSELANWTCLFSKK